MIFTEQDLKKSFLLYREGFTYDDVMLYFKEKQPSLYDSEKIKVLIEAVTNHLMIDKKIFTSKYRGRYIIDARAIYYYLARTLTNKTLKSIGEAVNKDHATVLNGFNQLKDLIDIGDKDLKTKIEEIKALYYSYIDARVFDNKNKIDNALKSISYV